MPCAGCCHTLPGVKGTCAQLTRHCTTSFTPQPLPQNKHSRSSVHRRQHHKPRRASLRPSVRVCSKQEQRDKQVEKSELAHTEIALFMFQMKLDMQLQRALNMDDFERAQDIRARREQIDEVVASQLALKGPGCGTSSANQTVVADLASEGLRLRSELQRAIDEERYSDAAEIRDRLKVIQDSSSEAASQDSSAHGPERKYQLGQRVKHSELGYDGVICGWDNSCCEDEKWQETNAIAGLQHGLQQPFYQVLVDAKDWAGFWARPAVAYLAQELLEAPEPPATWPEVHGYDSFDHVYLYDLFLGQDAQGNMLPVRQLRDRYSQQRKDVYPKNDSSEGADDFSPPD